MFVAKMCGIVGVFNNDEAVKIAIDSFKIIKNRGQDGYGVTDGKKITQDTKIISFLKKLEKLKTKNIMMHNLHKLGDRGLQPLKSNKGLFICDCEIYNWQHLTKKHQIKAKTDAELLMLLFEKYYPNNLGDFYEDIDGPFALAYWTDAKVVVARDLIGMKPLCYRYDKDTFMFASENKILDNKGKMLDPTKVITYNTKTKKLTEQDIRFYSTKPTLNHYKKTLIDEVKEKITLAIEKRTRDVNKFGILFSGGVDSSIITTICKDLKKNFICYNAVFEHKTVKMPQDIEFARKIAKELKVPFKIIKVGVKATEEAIKQVIDLIETTEPEKVGAALPLFLAARQARKDRIKVLLTPRGTEEIFAGYEHHRQALIQGEDVNRVCANDLKKLYSEELYKDNIVTMIHNVEIRSPYLDRNLVSYVIKIPPKFKLDEEYQKLILREVAQELGLRKDIAFHRKRTLLGTDFSKSIQTIGKKKGFRKQEDFLESL
ncbi:hypothetical protein DRJ17_02710 [Candidatus Woesearchaeota archaeon]|nr:MAG: hypothetical protein DRJ17_02710 [Candidatus Woesearchaeota archaeon]